MEKGRTALLADPKLFKTIDTKVRAAAKGVDIATGEVKS
jgi:hypothetical protein